MAKFLDVISYSGPVSPAGYEAVCGVLKKRKQLNSTGVIVIATPGGDPHAAFRIARALQHTYGDFSILIPRFCKSAGTLIAIGASVLFLDDMSELGPLDVQVKKGDELIGSNSGLDIFQAVNYLQGQAMASFRNYVTQLTREVRLSTKLASDISVNLAVGMLEPIAAQIDPMKLAEMQRATEIAVAYGNRLNEKSQNLRANAIESLVTGYPSHGFVIDRKEAKKLFIRVERPEGPLAQLSESLQAALAPHVWAPSPFVQLNTYQVGDQGAGNASTDPLPPSTGTSSEGATGSQSTGDGSSATASVAAPSGKPPRKRHAAAKPAAPNLSADNVAKLRA